MTTALEGGERSASRPGRSLPPGKSRYPLYRRLGGPQGRSGQVRKISHTTGIRSPDLPARSQSLYWLRYPAHWSMVWFSVTGNELLVPKKRQRNFFTSYANVGISTRAVTDRISRSVGRLAEGSLLEEVSPSMQWWATSYSTAQSVPTGEEHRLPVATLKFYDDKHCIGIYKQISN